jgi:hypothetical protein
VRPRRQRGAAMHLAADAASDTAHNGGDRMCRRSDCLLVVFGACYFAPNICSSQPELCWRGLLWLPGASSLAVRRQETGELRHRMRD